MEAQLLLGTAFSWPLFWADVSIYFALQLARMWVDVALPDSWYDPRRSWFRTRRWERGGAVYERIGIARWKRRLPTVTSLNRFSKKALAETSPQYLGRFILETCRGESHHVRSIAMTPVFAVWNPAGLTAFIVFASVVAHLPFILVQRYNRPRLQRLQQRAEARKLRQISPMTSRRADFAQGSAGSYQRGD